MIEIMLIVLLVVLVIAVAVVAVKILRKQAELKAYAEKIEASAAELAQLVTEYQVRVAEYRTRFKAVEPHLSDYFNTIPQSSHHFVHRLRESIARHEEMCDELGDVLEKRRVQSYDKAIERLNSLLEAERSDGSDPEQLGWGEEIEELLQVVGREVYMASSNQEFQLPRQHGRRPTLESLKIAGIRIPEAE